MKAIKVDSTFIIRQVSVRIDRQEDNADFTLQIEPIFGSEYSQETSRQIQKFWLSVTKKSQPVGWALIKDSSADVVMGAIAQNLRKIISLMQERKKWEMSGDTRKYAVQETVGGELKYWWEGEDGYEEAAERTGHEPTLEEVEWSKQDQFFEYEKTFVLAEVEEIYKKIEELGAVEQFGEVIDI